jgi:hypothetical protein
MYLVAYMNYCLLHLNLYGSSNFVLCVLMRLKCMLDVCMYVFGSIARPVGGWGCYTNSPDLSHLATTLSSTNTWQ